MTQADTQTYCSESVLDSTGWHRSPCSRKKKLERDGKPYCTQHDPERVAERRAARDVRRAAENATIDEHYRRRAAEARACEGLPTEWLEAGLLQRLVEAVDLGQWGYATKLLRMRSGDDL